MKASGSPGDTQGCGISSVPLEVGLWRWDSLHASASNVKSKDDMRDAFSTKAWRELGLKKHRINPLFYSSCFNNRIQNQCRV